MYLNCHTYYSLRYGTMSPAQLVQQAKIHGVRQLVLTDVNNTSCAVEFCRYCNQAGIKAVLGIEFRIAMLLCIGIAHNALGWRFLCQCLTEFLLQRKEPSAAIPYHPDISVIHPISVLKVNRRLGAHEYIGVKPWQTGSWIQKNDPRMILWHPVTFASRPDFFTHQLLRAIDLGTDLQRISIRELAEQQEVMIAPAEYGEHYPSAMILADRADQLLARCTPDYFEHAQPNLQLFSQSAPADRQLLRSLAYTGLRQRYAHKSNDVLSKLEYELSLIYQLDFTAYFLIAWDLVRAARTNDFWHVGRGSGANSLVAYCLYITDVDPLELNLLLERFINPHRPQPPDFDLDFNWSDRDVLLTYMHDRYGHDRVALLATYQTFKGRAIVRELGKVLGLTKKQMDVIVNQPMAQHKHHPMADRIFQWGRAIQQFPSHLSIHAGGVIIGAKPITTFGAKQPMPKGFSVSQFDMRHAEMIGFHKYDVLSQRGLGHIRDTMDAVAGKQGLRLDLRQMDMVNQDRQTLLQLASGDALGCFYIESPAMRGLLTKLRCRNYLDLVAASSVIRPGVAKSGMMQTYLRRRQGQPYHYLHPVMENLSDTYGVMIYQEDVMLVVHQFAGFDLHHSDLLRRLMTGKQKDRTTLRHLRHKFFKAARARGHDKKVTAELWRQIKSFSGYAFCKAHSATYAAESMQSLYLKAHYPVEFLVAVINNFGGYYRTEVYFRGLQKHGAQLHLPCLNASRYLTYCQGIDVQLGLVHIKHLRRSTVEKIADARREGQLLTLDDTLDRIAITTQQWMILIDAGALDFLQLRRAAMHRAVLLRQRYSRQSSLFDRPLTVVPDDGEEAISRARSEWRSFGFTLHSPFRWLESHHLLDTITAAEMSSYANRYVYMVGYYVIHKPVTTDKGEHMCYGTFWDQKLDFFDTVHPPSMIDTMPALEEGMFYLEGKILLSFGFPTLEAKKVTRLPMPYQEDEWCRAFVQ